MFAYFFPIPNLGSLLGLIRSSQILSQNCDFFSVSYFLLTAFFLITLMIFLSFRFSSLPCYSDSWPLSNMMELSCYIPKWFWLFYFFMSSCCVFSYGSTVNCLAIFFYLFWGGRRALQLSFTYPISLLALTLTNFFQCPSYIHFPLRLSTKSYKISGDTLAFHFPAHSVSHLQIWCFTTLFLVVETLSVMILHWLMSVYSSLRDYV